MLLYILLKMLLYILLKMYSISRSSTSDVMGRNRRNRNPEPEPLCLYFLLNKQIPIKRVSFW